ncbi:hypothetical protein [Bradyrhizobium sp. BR 1432]|uniref:hypothetical protein n=1 Tax=Bradyrhizobium sp. BR 1432 TaxID=3447966 RepID=UPI003EE476CE
MRVALAILLVMVSTAAFAFEVKMGPVRGPIQSKEPKDNGGGAQVHCDAPGEVVSGIQLGRDPDGQRWVNVWCRKITVE